MARRKRRAPDDVADMLGENFFVADAILHRTDRTRFREQMRSFFNGLAGVSALGCNDAKIAGWNFPDIRGCAEARGEVRRAADAQAARGNRARVFFPNVVGEDLGFARTRQMRRKNAADSSATYDADLHGSALRLLRPRIKTPGDTPLPSSRCDMCPACRGTPGRPGPPPVDEN